MTNMFDFTLAVFFLGPLLQGFNSLVNLLERPALKRWGVQEGAEIESMIVGRVVHGKVRRRSDSLLVPVDLLPLAGWP